MLEIVPKRAWHWVAASHIACSRAVRSGGERAAQAAPARNPTATSAKDGSRRRATSYPARGATDTPRAPVRSMARATRPEALASSTRRRA